MPRLIAMSGANVSSVDRHHDLGRVLVSRLQFWRRRDLELSGYTVRSVTHGCVIRRRTRQKCFQELRRLAMGMPGAQLCLKPPKFRPASVRKQFRQGRPRDIHEAWTPSARADADARRVDRDGPEKRLDFPGPLISETPEFQAASTNTSAGDEFLDLGLEDQTPKFAEQRLRFR
jgi:hypothetical protein